jgi:hypothetical protein
MVLLWNTTGQIENLKSIEQFSLGDTYSISILVVDPETSSTIDTKMFPNVSSKKNPLVQMFPSDFNSLNTKNVNVIIQDNTFYTTQEPLSLFLQYDQTQPSYLISFTSVQSLNNGTMRSASVLNVPYKNLILTFNNRNDNSQFKK